MEHIKVNLPSSERDYIDGCGEGCFVLVEADAKKAYDTDESGTEYTGILDNDSLYYPGLMHGVVIPFEMRGEKRPVCPYLWLIEHYGEPAPEWTGGADNE